MGVYINISRKAKYFLYRLSGKKVVTKLGNPLVAWIIFLIFIL